MSASSTSSPLPSSSSTMTNYLPSGSFERPPQVDGDRAAEQARFTFPTILIIVVSVILFFVFMYFYLSPIIRDPGVVAPNSSKRLRRKDTEWQRCSPLVDDLEKALPLSPDHDKRERGLLHWFCRRSPASHSDTLTGKHSLGFSLFSSPSSADTISTPVSLPLTSPAYFPNPSATADCEFTTEVEYRLSSPPHVPARRISHLQRHSRQILPAVSECVPPRHASLYTYICKHTAGTAGPTQSKSPTPSPLSKVLCKRDSNSTIDSLARLGTLEQFMREGGSESPLSFLNMATPVTPSSEKMSPAPSVHSMLCR
ncbi:hypothetical protein BDQ17DRAFT_460343 [Cyathus striatus]|nr:hypothetical protein BDQ17DRAFT_460343 [Cyathus striatus]